MRIINFTDGFQSGVTPLAQPQPASDISVEPVGNLTETNVQDALEGIYTKHLDLSAGVHGITGSVVGTSDSQILTNKTFSSHIILGADNTYDLGESSKRFRDLFLGGDASILGDITVEGDNANFMVSTFGIGGKVVVLNKTGDDTSSEGAGIEVDRTGSHGSFIYAAALTSKWKIGVKGAESEVLTATLPQSITNKTIDVELNTVTNILNGNIKASAGIERTKLASGTANYVLINNGSGVMSEEQYLNRTRGGTGISSTATFPSSGVIVTQDASESLSNKTLASPLISGGSMDVSAPGSFALLASVGANELAIGGVNTNVKVLGNFQVEGTTINANAENLNIKDKNITINKGGNAASMDGSGITVDSDVTTGVLLYDSTKASKFVIGASDSTAEIITSSHSQTLTNKTIDASQNTITNISNAMIASGAGIARNKIAPGVAGYLIFNQHTSGIMADSGIYQHTDGNIGLGTAAPTAKLHLYSTTGSLNLLIQAATNAVATTQIQLKNSDNDLYSMFCYGRSVAGTTFGLSRAGNTFITSIPQGYFGIGTASAKPFILATNDTERIRIDENGKVGIGMTPTDSFEVSGNGKFSTGSEFAKINYTGVSVNRAAAYFNNSAVGGITRLQVSNVTSEDTTAIQINADGKVGIGTTPTELLHVAGNIKGNQLIIDNLLIDGNTLSSTNSNGSINLTPNGYGTVEISNGQSFGHQLRLGNVHFSTPNGGLNYWFSNYCYYDGTLFPAANIWNNGGQSDKTFIRFGITYLGDFKVDTAPIQSGAFPETQWTNKFKILNNGNVGFGNSTPSEQLDMTGSIRQGSSSTGYAAHRLIYEDASTSTYKFRADRSANHWIFEAAGSGYKTGMDLYKNATTDACTLELSNLTAVKVHLDCNGESYFSGGKFGIGDLAGTNNSLVSIQGTSIGAATLPVALNGQALLNLTGRGPSYGGSQYSGIIFSHANNADVGKYSVAGIFSYMDHNTTYLGGQLHLATKTGDDANLISRAIITRIGSLLIGTATDGMTASGSIAIAQDFAHRGTKAGFFNASPVTKTAVADQSTWSDVTTGSDQVNRTDLNTKVKAIRDKLQEVVDALQAVGLM